MTHPDASRRRRHFLANDHSAGRVQRCPATQRHRPDTYPVRLQGQETNEDDSRRQFLFFLEEAATYFAGIDAFNERPAAVGDPDGGA